MSKDSVPIAVIIGDIHFTVPTLDLATESVIQAMNKATDLNVPLVLNGDILDSKAIVRGECANRLIELLNNYSQTTYINIGNHDLISEKDSKHVLNFLKPYCTVVSYPQEVVLAHSTAYIIPYQTSSQTLQSILDGIPKGSTLIMHQGVQTAFLGHYTQDKTSLPPEAFADFRVVASHYHRAQDIKCGTPRKGAVGLFSYIGNPYTLSFGEASDGPKGFSVLYDDGSLKLFPTNLRKHVVIEADCTEMGIFFRDDKVANKEDIVWLKLHGFKSKLDSLDKKFIGDMALGRNDFKLDKIYADTPKTSLKAEKMSNADLFDSIIDNINDTTAEKEYLKKTWKEII